MTRPSGVTFTGGLGFCHSLLSDGESVAMNMTRPSGNAASCSNTYRLFAPSLADWPSLFATALNTPFATKYTCDPSGETATTPCTRGPLPLVSPADTATGLCSAPRAKSYSYKLQPFTLTVSWQPSPRALSPLLLSSLALSVNCCVLVKNAR